MGHHAACGEVEWIVGIRLLCCRCVFYSGKACAPAGCRKCFLEQPWRAWMIFRRAGPEDALLLFNFLVSNACVISRATSTGLPQLLKDLARVGKGKVLSLAHA